MTPVLFILLGLAQTVPDSSIQTFESAIKQQQFEQVAAPLASYVAAHPQSWQALYQLGYVDFRLHRFQASLTLLSRSLVLNDTFADSHKILAFDLNILGRSDLAIQELEKALALDPHSFEDHYELGRIEYDRGAYLPAIRELSLAQALNPSAVKVYHNLGLAFAAAGDNPKAVQNFERALALNAKQPHPSAWPLIDYASYFNLQGDFTRACDLLQKSLAIDNHWDQAYNELFKAYRGLNQPAAAIDSLQKAIALNPSKPEYHYALSRLYAQNHEPAKASRQMALYQAAKR